MRAITSRALLALTFATGLNGAIFSTAFAARAAAPDEAASGTAVSKEFASSFNDAQDLLKAGKGAEALAKLHGLDVQPDVTPYEKYLIMRLRAPAEYAANDVTSAATDFDALTSNSFLPAADRVQMLRALSTVLYGSEQYAKATVALQRYIDAGGDDVKLRALLPQAQYMNKDYVAAAKGFRAEVDATYAAGNVPAEKSLRLLASAYSQADDDVGYVWALEHVAVAYPKPEYWKEVVARGIHATKGSERTYVEGYRLKTQLLGSVSESDRISYAAMSAHEGYPEEAKHVLDEAYANKPFTGSELAEANKLRAEVNKAVANDHAQQSANEAAARNAKDGNALVSQGLLETVDGNAQQGSQLIAQGIAKGGLKAPEDAKLHLGYAQIKAGQDADALKTFQSINGDPTGIQPIVHVWTLYAQSRVHAGAAPTPVAAASK